MITYKAVCFTRLGPKLGQYGEILSTNVQRSSASIPWPIFLNWFISIYYAELVSSQKVSQDDRSKPNLHIIMVSLCARCSLTVIQSVSRRNDRIHESQNISSSN